MLISVHGTKPGRLASETFFKIDPVGYKATEEAVAKFGRTQYSELTTHSDAKL